MAAVVAVVEALSLLSRPLHLTRGSNSSGGGFGRPLLISKSCYTAVQNNV